MPILYAHRGAAAELPENTIPAFRLALDVGADAIETDAHLTADGHVVLSHDPTGLRMARLPAKIEESSLAQVQSWDVGRGFVGAHGESFAGRGYRIPTLEEALTEFPGVRFNVDAKSEHPRMAPAIVDVVHRLEAWDRVLLASFQVRTLQRIRQLGYRGKTGLAQAEAIRLFALPTSLLKRVRLKGAAAQIPYRMYGIDFGTRALVDKCHALGLETHYWTVNDVALAKRLLGVGADAIMTDDPRKIAHAMR